MKHLTVRRVPDDIARALEKEKQRRGESLNQTVIDLLRQSLGVGAAPRSNGLGAMAGTWTPGDFTEFEEAVAEAEQIDAELWR